MIKCKGFFNKGGSLSLELERNDMFTIYCENSSGKKLFTQLNISHIDTIIKLLMKNISEQEMLIDLDIGLTRNSKILSFSK